jgi:hypothetical protein
MKPLIAALILAGLGTSARAADAVLAQVQGQVYVLTEGSGKFVRAKGGEALSFGDHVRTGKGAIAQLTLSDRGALLVRGDSSFTLEGDADNTSVRFRFGEFLIGLRKALTETQTFKVSTPAAVAAVRGTLFWGKSDEAKTTTYAGFGHTIAVTAQGKTVLVHGGEKTTVAFGEAPADSAAHDIPVSYLDNFKIGGGLQGAEKLIDLPKKK